MFPEIVHAFPMGTKMIGKVQRRRLGKSAELSNVGNPELKIVRLEGCDARDGGGTLLAPTDSSRKDSILMKQKLQHRTCDTFRDLRPAQLHHRPTSDYLPGS